MNSPLTLTNARGDSLFAQRWESDKPTIGVVGIVHGLSEHSSRYEWVARKLADAGFIVFGYDQVGSGRSDGARGDVGEFSWLLDDIDCLLQEIQRSSGSLPILLYGHSLGGTIVLNHALRRRSSVSGIVATSPLLLPTIQPPLWKRAIAQLLTYVWPACTFKTDIAADQLSHDPVAQAARDSDPLIHRKVSARLALQMLAAGRWTLSHAAQLSIPTLLMHGTADPITSCEASCAFASAAAKKCSLRTWPGLLHELHWEVEREQVMESVIEWLKKISIQHG